MRKAKGNLPRRQIEAHHPHEEEHQRGTMAVVQPLFCSRCGGDAMTTAVALFVFNRPEFSLGMLTPTGKCPESFEVRYKDENGHRLNSIYR